MSRQIETLWADPSQLVSRDENRFHVTNRSERKLDQPITFFVVTHSHLDYAWFRRRSAARLKEKGLLVGAKEIVGQRNTNFTIEQAVAGREFRESLDPEERTEFDKTVQGDGFELTPMEIQQEVFLAGQEVLFWNVNSGINFWESIGGRPSRAFYLPDTFGIPSSMAKMLRHAGFDNIITMRGYGDEAGELGAVHNLVSDDGSSVLAVPMWAGYRSAHDLGRSRVIDGVMRKLPVTPAEYPEQAELTLELFLQHYESRFAQVGLPIMLLGNGCDLEEVDRLIGDIAQAAEARMQSKRPGIKIAFGTYEQYLDLIDQIIDRDTLHSFSGELRSGAEEPILRSIESTRMPLKQAAFNTEQKIYTADALLALHRLRQMTTDEVIKDHDHDPMRLAGGMIETKQKVLPVYSHDAISGCGADEVYSDMFSRLDDAWHSAHQVSRYSLANLGGRKDDFMPRVVFGQEFSIVNPLNIRRKQLMEIELEKGLKNARGVMVTNRGHTLPSQIIEKDGKRFAAFVVEVDGFSSAQIVLKEGEVSKPREREQTPTIENEFYKVDVLPDGSVAITDRESGKVTHTHVFEDEGEAGDEYNSLILDNETPRTTAGGLARARVTHEGPAFSEIEIEMNMPLPESLTPDEKARTKNEVPTPIKTTIRLAHGVDRIDFKTSLINNAKDHRLRLVTDTPGASDRVRAKEPFSVVERPAVPIQGGEKWVEPLPIPTSHAQGMVAAGDVSIFTKGLQEYQALANTDGKIDKVAVTLLRSVGRLSKDVLPTRQTGSAGPMEAAPDAQCLGSHEFEYSLTLRGKESNSSLLNRQNDYNISLEATPGEIKTDDILRVHGDNIVISSLAPFGDGVMLRVYNPNGKSEGVNIEGMFRNIKRCNALGEILSEEDARDTTLGKGEIASFMLT